MQISSRLRQTLLFLSSGTEMYNFISHMQTKILYIYIIKIVE